MSLRLPVSGNKMRRGVLTRGYSVEHSPIPPMRWRKPRLSAIAKIIPRCPRPSILLVQTALAPCLHSFPSARLLAAEDQLPSNSDIPKRQQCQVMSECPTKFLPSMSAAYRTHPQFCPFQLTHFPGVRYSKLCTPAALKRHHFGA